jgi:polyhydroxyalkanoate synthesis regulator phasin
MDLKRKIVITAAAGLAVVGAGGAIAADKLTSPKEESQAVLNDAAQQLGVQPSELTAALKKALSNRVDQAVKDGRLTKAEGDALKARINSGDFPLFGVPHGRGFGPFGRGHDGFFGHDHFLSTAADYLGLTQAQLRTQLNSGKTLAQVAKDRGKSVDGLVDKLVASKKERIEAAVKDGRLTRAQANEIEADLKQQVTDFVNNGKLEFHFRKFRGGGPGFREFRDGSGPGELPGRPDEAALELGPVA